MAIDSHNDKRWNKQIEYMTKLIREEEQQEIDKDKEIERLNNIIDKAIEYTEKIKFAFDFDKKINKLAFDFLYTDEGKKLLDILKEKKEM